MKQKSGFVSRFMDRLDEIQKRDPNYYWRKLDSYDLMVHMGKVKLFQLNLFRDDSKLRKAIVPLIAVASVLWIVQGWDSSVEQIEYFVEHIPSYLLGQISWSQLVFYYTDAYGKYLHYSAFVIYMLFYVGISKYLRDKLDVVNSQNVVASICFVALSVGLFEYWWQFCYFFFQNQPWVLNFGWPQARILYQNLACIVVGLMFILAIDRSKWKFNLDKWTLGFLSATVASMLLWIFYGTIFPVQTISVPITGDGIWRSSLLFPQTVYTIKTDITNSVMAGDQFWVQNDQLHLMNVLVKTFMTLTIFNWLKLRRKDIVG